MRRSLLPVVTAGLGLVLMAPTPALAAKQLSFTLVPVGQPSYFKFSTSASHVVTGQLEVKSLASSTRTIVLRPADVGTGATGGLSYGSGKPRRVGRWIHLGQHQVTVPAGSSVVVPFKVKVPRRPGKGERFAGIVGIDLADLKAAKRAPKPRAGKPIALKYLPRFAVTVQLNLPGRRTHHLAHGPLKIKVTPSGAFIDIPLSNTGNSLIDSSSGSATILESDQALATVPIKLSQFVPGTATDYLLAIPGRPVQGTYQVSGFLKPSGGPRLSLNGSASFGGTEASQYQQQTGKQAKGGGGTPWWLIAALAVLAALVAILAIAYQRARNRADKPPRPDFL